MPFTFSHPAAIFPFLKLPKKWRSMTGLVVGSMVPDFEKFLRMSEHDPYSHTWKSLFYFNLPLGLLLAFVFHGLVRDALLQHLPRFLRLRFSRYVGFDWVGYFKRNHLVVALSVLVGAASHLAWDSFTHDGGWGVRLFPGLKQEVLSGLFSMKCYALLQKITSMAGGLAMVWFILLLPKGIEKTPPPKSTRFWGTVAAVALAVMAVRSQVGTGVEIDSLYNLSIVGISAGLTSLVLSPVLLRFWNNVQQP
ncbi:DUF4184 family protein [Rufibacter quisquiliarum]|uniref:DUF4184 family protein n=1 Tax=Rufibacter quisquiliarum TaxID=1549639 RepID=A0A839GJL2_9BACT|nr:DUF4184 family protein [Rufibacter quisquiliarum]MBA9076959.1 hypothetical protein [Rufibacter quisquiliarum]